MTEKPWSSDDRPIVAARLPSYPYGNEGVFLAADGWQFKRIEHCGEMAPIPYLRMTGPRGQVIEAHLSNFNWIELEAA